MGDGNNQGSRFFLVPFFTVHSGIFMSVHFMFLWDMFAGSWAPRVHNVREFVAVIVIATGLWLPLIALFISRGFSFLLNSFGARIVPDSLAFLRPQPDAPRKAGAVLYGFYGRIVAMHLAIIFGGMLAVHLGTMAPLILLIAMKVAADLGFHFAVDLGNEEPKAGVATTA
jgi:ABC-type phosphate transport system permease subunit